MFVPFKRKCRSTKRETFECDRQAEKLEEVNDKRAKGERQNVGGAKDKKDNTNGSIDSSSKQQADGLFLEHPLYEHSIPEGKELESNCRLIGPKVQLDSQKRRKCDIKIYITKYLKIHKLFPP
ncbi:hypothetical protein WR25_19885 [Diploscapter pachys]|uniref:Uncharacterized protein n=1 Tax=Diploscapter pachys TaxID=2018661 RepID=A0A2A2LBF0_9BILA|nr:hypothetical protein WR25_19885 [Diploscapter pachys]